MKKALLITASLLAAVTLVGCDDIIAAPSNGKDELVEFTSGDSYFQNDYQKVYDQLVSSGNLTSLTFKHLIQTIVTNEVDSTDFFEDLNTLKQELIDEEMLNKVSSSSYAENGKFYETKLIDSLATSLYTVTKDTVNHDGIYIKPDTTVYDVLGDGYCTYKDGTCTGRYAEYVQKEILPDINQKLLIAKYICQESFSSLGRAYARKVSYVKLENIDKKPGAASKLLNKWLNDVVNNHVSTTKDESGNYTLDLDSLARIWKGMPETDEEKDYVNSGEYYSLTDEIEDEIKKVAATDANGNLIVDANGNFTMLPNTEIDTTVEDKYTNSGAYPLAVGYESALRTLSAKQISDSDLYTKTNGISALPSVITERIFSSSVSSYCETATLNTGDNAVSYHFLFPKTTQTSDPLSRYYFYNSDEDAYYVVVIEDYDYSSSDLKKQATYDDDENVVKVTNEIARIALDLSTSSTYKNAALLKIFDDYGLGDTRAYKSKYIYDQKFYDYMEENYADLFD